METVEGGIASEMDLLLKLEAKAVFDKHYGGKDDPEQIGRIQFAIKSFAELIGKGAEVHPSLQAPEEVANLFPDPAKLSTIASAIKQIAEKAD